MKIGLLSDTHGHLARSHAAIQCLLEQEVECLIHGGDIGSEQILIELAADCHADQIPVYAVTGNVDLDRTDIIDSLNQPAYTSPVRTPFDWRVNGWASCMATTGR